LPAITTLSDGDFAVTYEVIDFIDPTQVVSEVFNGQGQLVQEIFAPHMSQPGLHQRDPDIAGLSGGGFASAWIEQVPLVTGVTVMQLFTAVYDNAGNEISTPVGVDADPATDVPSLPQVKALTGGGYVVTWLNVDDAQAGSGDLMAAVYNSAGQQVVGPINVTNSPGVNDAANFLTSVAALPNGGFALTWTTGNLDSDHDVYTAIYTAQGQQVLAPLDVTQSATIDESSSQIAVLANGNYALTWDGIETPFQPFTYTAVFDQQGNQIAAPTVVAPGQLNHIAALTNGNYAVSWLNGDIFTAVYDGQGHQLVAPIDVSHAPASGVFAGGITALANGAYAVTWDAQIADGSYDIFTAVYSAQGQQLVAPVNVSNTPGFDEQLETVDARATANGSYAITWQGPGTLLPAEYLAIYQFVSSQSVGNISVIGGSDINLDLSAIINVGGDVTISNNQNLITIDLHNLASIGGNFVLSNNGALLTITLPSLTTVSGDLDISGNTGATVIGVGGLTSVGSNLDISGNTSAGAIDVGGLTSVGGNLDLSGNTSATVIDVGGLTSVGSNLDISGNTSVITIDLGALIQAGAIVIANNGVVTLNLSALVQAGGDVSISNNHSLLTVDMPELTSIGGDFDISGNTSAGVINVGGLTSVGGDLDIGGNDSATVINVASLTTVGGDLTIDLAPDATVDASALGAGGGSVHVIGDDGRENTVVLGSLAQMQGTLTITTADGVTLTSAAGLGTITLTGTDAGNTLIGSATAKNIINSGGGNDTATGGNNDDLFTSGAGDDTLDGKGGTDTAVYSGSLSDYSVVRHRQRLADGHRYSRRFSRRHRHTDQFRALPVRRWHSHAGRHFALIRPLDDHGRRRDQRRAGHARHLHDRGHQQRTGHGRQRHPD
jgi:hypothetical protein